MTRRHPVLVTVALAVAGTALLGCTAPTGSAPTDPTADVEALTGLAPAARVTVAGTVATDLTSPWGLAFLPDGSALVAERDTARVKLVRPGAAAGDRVRTVGSVPGVVPGGEGGLLGLAVPPGADPRYVLAYITAANDNRVLRIGWDGSRLGSARAILTGIPKASIHNGGRLRFGPDGFVYVSTGDSGNGGLAPDRRSLAGKILRITPTGAIPADNPFPGSAVWSLGHRNVQGLAFDRDGRLWATEFGQSDTDELNLIRKGADYGWPTCEGACDRPGKVDPVVEWSPTSIASPSGLAIKGRWAYVASLRGEVLYRIRLRGETTGPARRLSLGDRGRLRTIETGPSGQLWLVTGNTDGRGSPRPGDDKILRLRVT